MDETAVEHSHTCDSHNCDLVHTTQSSIKNHNMEVISPGGIASIGKYLYNIMLYRITIWHHRECLQLHGTDL